MENMARKRREWMAEADNKKFHSFYFQFAFLSFSPFSSLAFYSLPLSTLKMTLMVSHGTLTLGTTTGLTFDMGFGNGTAELRFTGTMADINNALATLSYLGAGVQAPTPSWGEMINEGVNRITTAPHLTIIPGLMLVLTVLALNVFGDGVRDAFDPHSQLQVKR